MPINKRFQIFCVGDGSEEQASEFSTNRSVQGSLRRYVILLYLFFILSQVLFLLIDFRFLGALEEFSTSEGQIAAFLGVFNGILGIFEVTMQWLASSRLIERVGVFLLRCYCQVASAF